ncbi:MAG: DUF6516 family protein [bacterium]
MYEIVDCLKQHQIVRSVEILELVNEQAVKSIKIRSHLIDESILFIQETISEKGKRYSYHWQNKEGELILRWDNAPHWKNVETFPHHKHIGEKIEPSSMLDIKELLEQIEKVLSDE